MNWKILPLNWCQYVSPLYGSQPYIIFFFCICFVFSDCTKDVTPDIFSSLPFVNVSPWDWHPDEFRFVQDIVNAICDDDDIKAVSFVGSNTVSTIKHIFIFFFS